MLRKCGNFNNLELVEQSRKYWCYKNVKNRIKMIWLKLLRFQIMEFGKKKLLRFQIMEFEKKKLLRFQNFMELKKKNRSLENVFEIGCFKLK